MAVNPQSELDSPREMGAALVLVGNATTGEELDTTMVVTWFLSEGVPFATSNEAYDAMEVTSDLLEQIEALMEADQNFVPEGFTSERWAFFRNALRDGVQAIEAELPELEEVDEVTDSFEDMYDGLVMAGMVIVPEPVSEDAVDLTTES